jgi:hypothetical protein
MSYIVIKTINRRQYRYLQRSYRVGKKVRTESRYLGPVDCGLIQRAIDLVGAQRLSPEDRAIASADRQAARIDEEQRALFGESATERSDRERQEHLDKLQDLYGLTLGPSVPTPVEKDVPSSGTDAAAETANGQDEAGVSATADMDGGAADAGGASEAAAEAS